MTAQETQRNKDQNFDGSRPISYGMKVLMISSDRRVLEAGSAVSLRMKDYAAQVEELHIVVLCDASEGLKEGAIDKNVWAYPTNSSIKFTRPFDAARIGKRLVIERGFVRGKSIITAQDPFECGWAGLKIKKRWRLPLEVQVHTDPFSPYFSGTLNRVRKFIARRVLKRVDRIRAVSREVAERLGETMDLSSKIYILPIAVDQEKITSGNLTFDLHARYGWTFVLLAVARLEKEKNLGFALRALAEVRKTFPDTGLVIVGSGSEEKHLRSLSQKLGLEGFVDFIGWQNNLASFYKSANVFIQTSIFEGYGLALIEAGLNGLPVISTPVGIAKEFENGRDLYLVNHNDIESLAAEIGDLLANNYKRETLKMNLKKTLESRLISKEEFVKELIDNWQKGASLIA